MGSQMHDVHSSRGAPMGRRSSALEGKVRLFRVRLDAGGYDDGGAYWGIGGRLYCAEDSDGGQRFTRAGSRANAAHNLGITGQLVRPLTARDHD